MLSNMFSNLEAIDILAIILGVVVIALLIAGWLYVLNLMQGAMSPAFSSGRTGRREEDHRTTHSATAAGTGGQGKERQEDFDSTVLMQDEKTELLVEGIAVTLTAENSGEEYKCICLCNSKIKIGRNEECDIQIQSDKTVSRIHCFLSCNDSGILTIRDNQSANGTYLNDEKLTGESQLESGDTIEIGRIRYNLRAEPWEGTLS